MSENYEVPKSAMTNAPSKMINPALLVLAPPVCKLGEVVGLDPDVPVSSADGAGTTVSSVIVVVEPPSTEVKMCSEVIDSVEGELDVEVGVEEAIGLLELTDDVAEVEPDEPEIEEEPELELKEGV